MIDHDAIRNRQMETAKVLDEIENEFFDLMDESSEDELFLTEEMLEMIHWDLDLYEEETEEDY